MIGNRIGWQVLTFLCVSACSGDGCGLVPEIPPGQGETCTIESGCFTGLVCSQEEICMLPSASGPFPEGSACFGSAQCELGTVCNAEATCAPLGTAGTAALGETCDDLPDCQFGLACLDGTCRGFEFPFWLGAQCPAEDEGGDFRVLFEVPDGEVTEQFYRLPFPNDARRIADGRIDLSGHPTPGALIDLLGDPVAALIDAIEAQVDGFGPNQATFVRFNTFPDTGTLTFGDLGVPFLSEGGPSLALVDLSPTVESPVTLPASFKASSARGQYICRNWLAVNPFDGRPLDPGTTYALLLSTDVLSKEGTPLKPDPDFAAMLSDTEPSEPRLAAAWPHYAPLRAWISKFGLDASRIAGGTVFTTQDTTLAPQYVHDAVAAGTLPTLTAPIVCGDGDDPFADGDDESRGCTGPSALFTEIQGTLGLPQFQEGTPPFKEAEDGGAIDLSAGPPAAQRTLQVNVTITVPKDLEMPESGWPVIVYAHGTGGSYTSVIRSGFADDHTRVDVGEVPVGYAMIGFDAPMHGPRNFLDTYPQDKQDAWTDVDPHAFDPDVLFFNPLNLAAARANVLQQAADVWSLVRFVASYDEEVGPAGEALRFDPERIVYAGHSQGGVVGPIAAAWEPRIAAVLLSGAGGMTIYSLLDKTSPNDIPAAVKVALVDTDLTRTHPVLNLAQMLAEASDGVNHARYLVRTPPEGFAAKHVLQIVGLGDTFSPVSTQEPLARALGVQQLNNDAARLNDRIQEVDDPARANVGGSTAVVVAYEAEGDRDAHFVMFDRADAQAHVSTFLGTFVTDEDAPTVSETP